MGWTGVLEDGYNGHMEDSGKLLRLVGIAVVVAVLLVAAWFLFGSRREKPVEPSQIQEVTLTRGDTSITLTRGGTLTVRVPEGVFQQQWDEERVRAFFAQFEAQDFTPFEAYGEETDGYILTIVTADGEQKTYVLPFLGVPLPEVVEEFIETLEELSSAVPTPTLTPTPIPTPIVFLPTPTPIPTLVPTVPPAPTPTPTPSGGDGGTGGLASHEQPFECQFTDPDIKPDILSETVCTPE